LFTHLLIASSIPEISSRMPENHLDTILKHITNKITNRNNMHFPTGCGDITFGVEFEFALIELHNRPPHLTVRDPSLDSERRCLHFPPRNKSDSMSMQVIFQHIAKTLVDAGVDALPETHNNGPPNNYTSWWVTYDPSIDAPAYFDHIKFGSHPIELISPVLKFEEAGIKEVLKVCEVITNSYCVNFNETCGLHVHVGLGNEKSRFQLEHVKRLYAFLWAFEPQFDSLHPPHRFNNLYCETLRGQMKPYHPQGLAQPMMQPLVGIIKSLRANSIVKVGDVVGQDKYQSYNISSLVAQEYMENPGPSTVEIRQHAATMDPVAVYHWIHVCVGIIRFTRDVDMMYFHKLLSLAVYEDFDDIDSGKLPLCETDLTIIDLLKAMVGLEGGPGSVLSQAWFVPPPPSVLPQSRREGRLHKRRCQ